MKSARNPLTLPRDPALTVAAAITKMAKGAMQEPLTSSPEAGTAGTSMGVDGSGLPYTVHPAFYDVDAYDDPSAIYYEA